MKPIKVLFVCLGNICRSPAADGVLKALVERHGLSDKVEVDSAGTSAYHVGEPSDGRMRETALTRGYELNSISRQFVFEDFEYYNYIITMDDSNYENVLCMDKTGDFRHKVFKFVGFCLVHDVPKVPDPYYGGAQGFDFVMDIIEDGCQGLLQQIIKELEDPSVSP